MASNSTANFSFYSALSHPPVCSAGNSPDLSIYRPQGNPKYGNFKFQAPAEGLLQVGGPHSTETAWSDEFEIAWTKMGNKGPLVLFLHGVPTNRAQWEEVQGHVSRFCETISIDMLGMGESSKPRLYGRKHNSVPHYYCLITHSTIQMACNIKISPSLHSSCGASMTT